jgi:tetratricopeptide (TPR) repeat protein
MNNFDLAIADFKKAVDLKPKFAGPHSYLARILAICPDTRYRDAKKAVAWGTRGCELSEWKDGFCLESLALAYNESGDFDRAVETQEKAIKLLPLGEARQSSESQLTQFKFRKLLKDNG